MGKHVDTGVDLIRELEGSLTGFNGEDTDVSKTITLLAVAVVNILKDLGRLSAKDFEALEIQLGKVRNLKQLIHNFVLKLSDKSEKLSEIRDAIASEYIEDSQFKSLEYFMEGQEGVRKSISILIELISFLSLLNDPLQELESTLSSVKDDENRETLREKTEKLSEARFKLRELESSLREFFVSLHKAKKNIEKIFSGTASLYTTSKSTLRVENEEDQSFMEMIFGGSSRGEKDDFIFHENLPLSTVYSDIFAQGIKITRDSKYGSKKEIIKVDKDKEDDPFEIQELSDYDKFIIKLKNTAPHIAAFREQTFHQKDRLLEMIESVFGEYSGIEDSYLDLMEEYQKEGEEEREFVFKSSLEDVDRERERIKMFSGKNAAKFKKKFNKLLSGKFEEDEIFSDTDIEKYTGDETLCILRAKAYKALDSIFDKLIAGEEDINTEYDVFHKACSDYIKYYDKNFGYLPKKKTDLGERKFTHHYSIQKDKHDKVAGLNKIQLDTAPSKSIGRSINEVRQKVKDICTLENLIGGFLELFPGEDKSKNNILVLGPYGTGKTALIKELAYDDSIATIQVQASDLLSMWYGVAEQNFKKLFEQAHKLHKETDKKVFIMVDEFEQLSQMSNSTDGNQQEAFQKELQVLLDGVQEYEGVHLIGLSNEPKKLPPALIRRMDTVVTERLTNEERFELIDSRYKSIPMENTLKTFLSQFGVNIDFEELEEKVSLWCILYKGTTYGTLNTRERVKKIWEYISEVGHEATIEDIEDHTNFSTNGRVSSMSEEEKEVYKYLYSSTPKILTSICEKAYSICLQRYISEKGERYMKALNKKLLNYKTQRSKEQLLKNQGISISFDDILEAGREIFKNPTIMSQIEVNGEFYEYMRSIGFVSGVFKEPKES